MSSQKQLLSVLVALAFLVFAACEQPTPEQKVLKFQGGTMGTSYHVTVIDPSSSEVRKSVDSLLVEINREVNTYDENSLISRLNKGDTIALPVITNPNQLISAIGGHLAANLQLALKPMSLSSGAFDPTVGPLTEYYGFGASKREGDPVDPAEIKRLLQFVGFSNIHIDSIGSDQLQVNIARLGVRLDLSAIAKGYAVDQLAHLMEERFKSTSYFVEIGGETRAAGRSPRDAKWTIGVNRPQEGASLSDLELIIGISNAAIATSGNYRNRRIIDGKSFVHTIDPQTGIAKPSSLLSATVVASDCATADAFATACMASSENAEEVLAKAGLSGCLIFAESDSTFVTRYVGDFEMYVLTSN
ncbi:MAG: FAD:protein FMN transferase [Saprospiraceae bacterium]